MIILREYAMSMLGLPYIYGGNSPLTGLDCSGFVCELLKSCGVLSMHEDLSAQLLYNKFAVISPNRYGLGSLAFYGKAANDVSHVALCLDPYRMIEAGGGDRATLTKMDAASKNACVRIRLIRGRADFLAVAKPDYATIGII